MNNEQSRILILSILASLAVASAFALTSCAVPPQQQAQLPSYPPATLVNPPQKPVNVPANPLDSLSPDVRAAFESSSSEPIRRGITTIFRYSPDSQPTVNCEVLRVTTVRLNSDEHIKKNGVTIGDNVRWLVSTTDQEVAIKPGEPGISTNLGIETDHGRSYSLLVRSGGSFMPRVAYWYPEDIAAAEAVRATALHQSARQAADPIPQKPLNFNYKIVGPNYAWRPVQAFSDGTNFYVQLPENIDGADMPVLYAKQGGKESLVNYEVKEHNYLVADRVLHEAVLSSGTGANRETVEIEAP